ncbi:type II toxin-antitoxin system PemK/MazF family toxin [Okeania sp. SIO2B3]|uniref:type II toxin-antitoxin system PemK/MazF family toxin n=1 Tax=Okeania sp. SIO2B3 TaxID=2607784 RepID=UPI0013C10BDE|nr:type II toxin-antitoxin system PemK/MazF family toxin [Okeania sp. SIO2B3]NET46978.1 hypothetical protein [Okeania sp. SIO2B3]
MKNYNNSDLYTPEKGNIVWINFNLQSGREQTYLRPALVVSSSRYNRFVGLALVCSITTKIKIFMF